MSGLTFAWHCRAIAASIILPPLVSLVSLERLAPRLGRAPRSGTTPDPAALAARVDQLLRRLPPPWRYTCLRRSVVLFHLFRRMGLPVTLMIGVRRDGERLAAHAWLTRDGTPYLEPSDHAAGQYRMIARFPEADGQPHGPG